MLAGEYGAYDFLPDGYGQATYGAVRAGWLIANPDRPRRTDASPPSDSKRKQAAVKKHQDAYRRGPTASFSNMADSELTYLDLRQLDKRMNLLRNRMKYLKGKPGWLKGADKTEYKAMKDELKRAKNIFKSKAKLRKQEAKQRKRDDKMAEKELQEMLAEDQMAETGESSLQDLVDQQLMDESAPLPPELALDPALNVPPPPADEGGGMSTTTVILLGVGALAAVGVVGWLVLRK